MLAMTKLLLQQNYVCCNKYLLWQTSNIILSRQKFCCNKHISVKTKLLLQQKWYLWQLPPMIGYSQVRIVTTLHWRQHCPDFFSDDQKVFISNAEGTKLTAQQVWVLICLESFSAHLRLLGQSILAALWFLTIFPCFLFTGQTFMCRWLVEYIYIQIKQWRLQESEQTSQNIQFILDI